MIKVITTWHNAGPHTIWGKLATRLGREPTRQEAADEVRRILEDAHCAAATAGRLPHQKKRRR